MQRTQKKRSNKQLKTGKKALGQDSVHKQQKKRRGGKKEEKMPTQKEIENENTRVQMAVKKIGAFSKGRLGGSRGGGGGGTFPGGARG